MNNGNIIALMIIYFVLTIVTITVVGVVTFYNQEKILNKIECKKN